MSLIKKKFASNEKSINISLLVCVFLFTVAISLYAIHVYLKYSVVHDELTLNRINLEKLVVLVAELEKKKDSFANRKYFLYRTLDWMLKKLKLDWMLKKLKNIKDRIKKSNGF